MTATGVALLFLFWVFAPDSFTYDWLALIDGDILAYEKAAAAEDRLDWEGDGKPAQFLKKEPEEVFAEVDAQVRGYLRKLGAERVIVCLSDPDANWRKSVYPLYKSNRLKT
jgi:hypothetical protein